MDTTAGGKHCVLCKQYDILAKNCVWCDSTFCKNHFMAEQHDCQARNLSSQNTFPTCPICNKKIKINSGDDKDLKVNQHIDSGCVVFVFKKEKKRPCGAPDCKSRKAPIKCQKCHFRFCVKHRFPDEHNCPSLPENKKKSSFMHPLLAKLGLRKIKIKKKAKPKSKRKRKMNADDKRMRIKSTAKGNKNIEMEDRFYMEIFFSPVLKKDPMTMFFKNRWNCGKILDLICKERSIVSKNHLPNERKLVLFCHRTCNVLPFEIPLQLLMPQLLSGDSVLLKYEDEVVDAS